MQIVEQEIPWLKKISRKNRLYPSFSEEQNLLYLFSGVNFFRSGNGRKKNRKMFKGVENKKYPVTIIIMDIPWFVVGSTAAILTMLGFVPQIIKIVKTKYVRDISFIMLIQTSLGASLWILYGIHISDPIVIVANIISLITLIVVITLFFIYRSNRENDNHPC